MASYPYVVQRAVVIAAAGGVGSCQIPVPTQQSIIIKQMIWTSTGIWGLFEISNSNGRKYTDCSQAVSIPSTSFQNGGSPNIGVLVWPYEIDLVGNDILNFSFLNTSGGANTIQLTFFGQITTG
jgi:hypothetical protein